MILWLAGSLAHSDFWNACCTGLLAELNCTLLLRYRTGYWNQDRDAQCHRMDFRPRMKPRWLSSAAKACLKELMAGFNSAHPLASSTWCNARLHLSDTAVWLTATLHRLAVTIAGV